MFEIEKIDRGIGQKTITSNDGNTITITVTMVTPTANNGLPQRKYGPADAAKWLSDAGHKIAECVSGGKVYNYNYMDSSKRTTSASWTFSLVKEEEAPKPAPKRRARAKATPVKETSVKSTEEFSGLNFDGEVAPSPKKTTRARKRKSTKRS